ncbi:MAG: hypothetical protein ABJB05_13945, partial [Parafilimonas sp.]
FKFNLLKNNGYYQFIAKWGIASSTFTQLFLKRGSNYSGALNEPEISFLIKLKNLYKRILAGFKL